MPPSPAAPQNRDTLIRQGLKLSHLRLMAALADTGQISAAAAHMAIGQPAASRLLAELEALTGAPLHRRRPRGIELTQAGVALASHAQKMLRDLDKTGTVLAELAGGHRGKIGVGAVTGPAIDHVLPALRQLRLTHPGIEVSIAIDTSDRLAERLLTGEVDFYIGRIPIDLDPRPFTLTPIGDEPVSLIARDDHPLVRAGVRAEARAEAGEIALANCIAFDWVLQAPGGLLRQTLEKFLMDHGLRMPEHVISTSSVLMTLALVSQTNAIAPLSHAVARLFMPRPGKDGLVTILNVPETLRVAPYGLVALRDSPENPAAQTFRALIMDQVLRKRTPEAAAP